MKADRLMDALGKVKEDYIMESAPGQTRKNVENNHTNISRNRNNRSRTASLRRALLIAAIIATLLLLVGCVAMIMGLNELKIGNFTYKTLDGGIKSGDFISLQGYIDSDNYKAAQEWNQFLSKYDPDGSLLKEAEEIGYIPPIDYMAYLCYTQDMVKKIDDICSKYNLELLGPTYGPTHLTNVSTEILAPLGIDSITAPSTDTDINLENGYYYRDGSFALEGDLDYSDSNDFLPTCVDFQYRCVMKTSFDGVALGIGNVKAYDQWNYTVTDGTEVLLALSENKALIIVDKENFFITINVLTQHMTCAGLEAAADAFIFNYSPRRPEPSTLVEPEWYPDLTGTEEIDTYWDYYSNWLPGSAGSEAYSPDYQQKFVDLDVDGIDEMLIWNARTGIIYEVVTRVNGELICVYGTGTYAEDDHTVSLYLCEGNILEMDCANLQGKQLNEYYQLQDHQLVMVECIMESDDGKFYWSKSGGASSHMWKEITEAEYDSVCSNYVRIGVPQTPATEIVLPIQSSDEILLQVLKDQALFFSVSNDESMTLEEYCIGESERIGFEVSITQYAFVDMDGDGIREAVVDFRFGENSQVMCMILKWNSSSEIVSGTEFYHRQMSQIKEDGSFAYSGGADNAGWAKLRWENDAWVTESVEDSSDKANIQWYSFPIISD